MLEQGKLSVLETLMLGLKGQLHHPFARNSALLATGSYISAGLNFLTSIAVARVLGPADYGILALAVAYPTLVWSFIGTKSVSVTIRYITGFRARNQHQELLSVIKIGYGLDFLVSVICLLLVALTAAFVNFQFYHITNLDWLMIAYAFSFPFYSAVGTSRSILTSWQSFNLLAFFHVLESATKLVLVIGALCLGFGVIGVVIANVLLHIGIGIVMTIGATRILLKEGLDSWWKGSLSQLGLFRKELASFLGWNYLFVTLNGFVEQIPLMLLGAIRGTEEAGFYRLAMNIKTVGSTIEGSMGGVAYPTLSARWAKGEREGIIRSLKRWIWRGGLPIGVLEALTIPFWPIVVPLVFGLGYKPAVSGVQILMGATAIRSLFFWLNSFYYASGNISVWVKGFFIQTVLLISLGWWAIQYAGFFGMVLVYSLVGLAFTLAMAKLAVSQELSFLQDQVFKS